MKTATERMMMPDRRRLRAQALTAAVIQVIEPYLDTRRLLRRASDDVFNLFMTKGVEVITDQERAEAGLSPRNDLGLTPEELAAIEHRRLELMLRPMPPVKSAHE